MKLNFMGIILVVLLVPVVLVMISSLCRRLGQKRPSELTNALLAMPIGWLVNLTLNFAGLQDLAAPWLAVILGMAGYCAREILRQSWTAFMPCRMGLYSCLLVWLVLGTGCVGMGHTNRSGDTEFKDGGGTDAKFGNAGPFTLFHLQTGVKRRTDEQARSGTSGMFADKSISGFSAETTGIKGGSRKYGFQSYEDKIRADAITAALDPIKNMVSDVAKMYLGGPLGDVWAGTGTTQEKLQKSAAIAQDDPKAPSGVSDELNKALEKLK